MGVAYINLEDMEDGTISLNIVYKDGFSLTSNAHQTANLITKWMDENLVKTYEPAFVPGEKDSIAGAAYTKKDTGLTLQDGNVF